MASVVKPETLRSAIAGAVAELKAYDVPVECTRLGLGHGDESEAFGSKYRYVMKRLRLLDLPRLTDVARKFLDEYESHELERLLTSFGAQGVDGEFKNIIFAANGPKPQIVLLDAVSNQLRIVRNAEYCLTYTRPLSAAGLSWGDLVDWWQSANAAPSDDRGMASQNLRSRLQESLASPPEHLLFETYCALYSHAGGFEMPALIPQVYLHYDPYTAALRPGPGPLERQRMDFLMLLPHRERVVIEVDGSHHYSVDGKANPRLYSEMVSEDRRLKLAGYEVYRFGGHELTAQGAAHMVADFFRQLFERKGISLPANLTGGTATGS